MCCFIFLLGLMFLLSDPDISTTIIHALKGANDWKKKKQSASLRYASVLISKGFFCHPQEVGFILEMHLKAVSFIWLCPLVIPFINLFLNAPQLCSSFLRLMSWLSYFSSFSFHFLSDYWYVGLNYVWIKSKNTWKHTFWVLSSYCHLLPMSFVVD